LNSDLLNVLACPRDHTGLRLEKGRLCCAQGHSYPIANGVPVFLLGDKEQTIGIASASLQAAENDVGGPFYFETLGIPKDQQQEVIRNWSEKAKVDPVISRLLVATCGLGYTNMVGKLTDYPIPDIPIDHGAGELLLDVGSNWCRWSVSAARKGWRVIAIDPSLGALMAARRAFAKEGLDISYVCGDARFLPFKENAFKCVFSYSVFQHLSETDASVAISEVARILRQDGFSKIQMAHKGGLRSTYIRTRADYKDGGIFRVRYWSLDAMRRVFQSRVGPTRLVAEAFGGLGLLTEDRRLVSARAKALIAASQVMKRLSRLLAPLILLADSVYVISTKR